MKVDLDSPHWQEMRSVYNFYVNTGIGCWKMHSYCIWFANLNAMWALYIHFSEFPTVVKKHPNAQHCNCPMPGKYCYEYQPDVSKSEVAMQVAKVSRTSIHRGHRLGWKAFPPLDRKPKRRKRKKGKLQGANRKAELSSKNCGSCCQIPAVSCFFVWFSGATLYKGSWVWVKMEEAVH